MSKAVLISIRPKWCELIAAGKKTMEVRKSRPKLDTPFKCYIYMTGGAAAIPNGRGMVAHHSGGRLAIGEFVCDRIYQYSSDFGGCNPIGGADITTEEITELSCLTAKELHDYEYSAEPKENCLYLVGLYGWHISNLVIYDRPKGLTAFTRLRKTKFGHEPVPVSRPPQSWCYVEELRGGGEG